MQEGAQKPPAGRKRGWLRGLSTRLHLEDGRFSDEDVQQTLQAVESGVRVGDLCSAQDIAVETYYRWKVRYGGLTLAELSRRRRRDRGIQRAVFALAAVVILALGYEGFVYLLGRVSAPAPAVAAVAPATKKPRPVPARGVLPAAQKQVNKPSAPGQPAVAQKTPPVTPAASASSPPPPPPAVAVSSTQKAPVVPARGAAQPAKPAPLPVATAAQQAPVPPAAVRLSPTNTAAAAVGVEANDPPGFSVQVAAVSNAHDARKTVERLTAAGYFAYITRTTAGQGEMFRVRVGPFELREQAEDAAARLKGAGYAGAWIAR